MLAPDVVSVRQLVSDNKTDKRPPHLLAELPARASHTAVEIVTQQNAGDVHEAGPAPAVVAYQRCDRVVLVAEILQRSKSVPNIPIRERYGRAIDASAISNTVGK